MIIVFTRNKERENYVINKKSKLQTKKRVENNKTIIRSQQRFRSELHNVFREKVNKITLNANDDKRLQTTDRVIS